MELRAAGLSDVGRARELNEDACFVGERVFAVADGLGGHLAGEVASSLALEPLQDLDTRASADALAKLADAVRRGNRAVYDRSQDDSGLKGMGTTMTAVALHDGLLQLAHVGDSRCYLLRDGSISRLSRDHTLVARMVDEGKLTAEQAEAHPQRSILTRALGAERDVDVDETQVPLRPRDRVLLCSDGLTAVLSDDEIRQLVEMSEDLDGACRALIDEANARGGPDNVTAVLVAVEGAFQVAPARSERRRRDPRRTSDRRVPVRAVVWVALLTALLLGSVFGVRAWADRSYFVGAEQGSVAIYRGLPFDLPGMDLSSRVEQTDLRTTQVTMPSIRRALEAGIRVSSVAAGRRKVEDIKEASGLATLPRATRSPSAKPSVRGSP